MLSRLLASLRIAAALGWALLRAPKAPPWVAPLRADTEAPPDTLRSAEARTNSKGGEA